MAPVSAAPGYGFTAGDNCGASSVAVPKLPLSNAVNRFGPVSIPPESVQTLPALSSVVKLPVVGGTYSIVIVAGSETFPSSSRTVYSMGVGRTIVSSIGSNVTRPVVSLTDHVPSPGIVNPIVSPSESSVSVGFVPDGGKILTRVGSIVPSGSLSFPRGLIETSVPATFPVEMSSTVNGGNGIGGGASLQLIPSCWLDAVAWKFATIVGVPSGSSIA